MVQVTTNLRGTARWAQIEEDGFEMAGKTGTSQVRRITAAERMSGIIPNDQRPWRDRDHALFVAFAPIHAPRYACAVVVEHGGGGSRVAAPIARDILLECQHRNPARALPTADLAGGSGGRDRG
jgi:penicillin-binding protein 2